MKLSNACCRECGSAGATNYLLGCSEYYCFQCCEISSERHIFTIIIPRISKANFSCFSITMRLLLAVYSPQSCILYKCVMAQGDNYQNR